MFLTYVPVRSGLGGGRAHFVTCFLPMLLIKGVMLFCRRGFESCSSGDWAPWCYLLAGQRLHFLQQYITGFHSDGCILHDIKQRQNKTCPYPPNTPPSSLSSEVGERVFASINLAHLESRPQRWRHEQESPQTAEISQTALNTLNASDALMGRLGAAGGGGVHARERKTT